MTARARSGCLVALALTLVSAGCGLGTGDDDTLAAAEAKFVESERGRVDLQLTTATSGKQMAGFRVSGTYSFTSPGPYPVLDLAYLRVTTASSTVQVVSNGQDVLVGARGAMEKLPPERAAALRRRTGGGAIADLRFSGWIRRDRSGDAKRGLRLTTGDVDAERFLPDFARTVQQVAGVEHGAPPDGARKRLPARLVANSQMDVVTRKDTGQLRSLHALVEFRPEAAPYLLAALGPYAGDQLNISLRFAPTT